MRSGAEAQLVGRHHRAESSCSSPSKSPNRIRLDAADQSLTTSRRNRLGMGPAADPAQPGSSQSPSQAGRGATQRPLFAGRAGQTPPPPLRYSQDCAPNIGDVTPKEAHSSWNIPAVRSETTHAPGNPGGAAAAKVSRRQAWTRFMAYDGATQICLEAMMQGSPDPAATFLMDGCQQLREALALGQLLLPPAAPGGAVEAAIYWDDREEGAAVTVEHIDDEGTPPKRGSPPHRDGQTPLAEQMAQLKLQASPVRQQLEAPDDARSVHSMASAAESMGPHVEARVLRVVGCPLLTEAGTGPTRGRRFRVVMHPAGSPADEPSSAWTTLSPDGGIDTNDVLRLYAEGPRGTVLVQLVRGSKQLAAGTVQVAELHKLASQHDVSADVAPSGNLFRHLQQLVRRKDQPASSMTWVRLVDGEGNNAGHVVLSARVVAGEECLGVGALRSGAVVGGIAGGGASPSVTSTPRPSAPPSPPRRSPARPPSPAAAAEAEHPAPTAVIRVQARGGALRPAPHTSGGFLHVNAQHVYDELLQAALDAAGCGPNSLKPRGRWAWLLEQYAQRYGVRPQYSALAHLRWVVRRDNAAPTAACLDVLAAGLAPLVQARSSAALSSAELALLAHVAARVDNLLTTAFDNYFALSEEARGGMIDGVLSVRLPGTPPALIPAVALLAATRGVGEGEGGGLEWLAARLRCAARKRFHALLAATESRRPVNEPRRSGGDALDAGPGDDPAAAWAYGRLEELASCVMTELRADEAIHASAVFPSALRLPEVTAVEYVRGVISHTQRVLGKYPPPAPSPAAVSLVEALGRLQDFVLRHAYSAAAARLNSRDIFGGFVQRWLAATSGGLARTLRALERAAAPDAAGWQDQGEAKQRVSPLVEGMLAEVEAEMRRYERIVCHWPAHGPNLEAALVAALRDATAVASRQCGLQQTKEEVAPTAGGHGDRGRPPRQCFGRVAWRWVAAGGGGGAVAFAGAPTALRRGISPHQALLLNSLRRLLAVVPQLEHLLAGWCGGAAAPALSAQSHAAFPPPPASAADRIARDAPDLGAHWAQLVKELRTEYYACITLCAEAIAAELAAAPATSAAAVLRGEAAAGAAPTTPTALAQRLRRCLAETSPLLRWLSAALDGRVFVALGRGLWDLAARDVLRFAEDLVEGGTGAAWRGRQHAAAAVRELDAFYRAELSLAMGSDLQERDMAPPQHAQRAAALLADNTASGNESFDVY